VTTDSPVIAIVYHRPERAAELLDVLRVARPRTLFLVADGPLPGDALDAELCHATRDAASRVDWPCDVVADFADEHLGVSRRVVSALDHAFQAVDHAIVLEEDVRPAPAFFPFCDAMLERFVDDERVVHVDGANRLGEWRSDVRDFHFARHGNVWGWATWARAWAHHDATLDRYRTPAARAAIAHNALDEPHRALLCWLLDSDVPNLSDEWDHQWSLSRYATGGLAIVPARNLTVNVGFGPDATHTWHADELAATTRAFTLASPFVGPPDVAADDDLGRELLRFERLRSLREATVPALLVRALTDPRVRGRLAPNPAVANALAVLDDPRAALTLLRHLGATGTPSPTRDQLLTDFERLVSLSRNPEWTSCA
jgi:hypothetical protein